MNFCGIPCGMSNRSVAKFYPIFQHLDSDNDRDCGPFGTAADSWRMLGKRAFECFRFGFRGRALVAVRSPIFGSQVPSLRSFNGRRELGGEDPDLIAFSDARPPCSHSGKERKIDLDRQFVYVARGFKRRSAPRLCLEARRTPASREHARRLARAHAEFRGRESPERVFSR